MTSAHTPAKMRWLGAIAALGVASSLGSTSPSDPDTAATRVAATRVKIVPAYFTGATQEPTKVCTKKPVAGETMIFTLSSSSATTTGSVEYPITTAPSPLNFAGLSGPAGVFASSVTLPAGNYAALNLTMSDVITIRAVITCDPDGAGPLPTRTYYTGGNADMTAPDPSVLDPALATPLETTITSGGGPLVSSLTVPFSIVSGANTTLNVLYDTEEGLALWNISVITGVPNSFKIVPNDMVIMTALPESPAG